MERAGFDPPITGVVVGYDGSERGLRALEWALAEARLRGLPLHVVQAWRLEDALRRTGLRDGVVPSAQHLEEAVQAGMEGAVTAARRTYDAGNRNALNQDAADQDAADQDAADQDAASAEAAVHCHAVEGGAAQVLLAAAETADLLVVGDRGYGGFAGLVLGSVADQVTRHARCTVVVVRD